MLAPIMQYQAEASVSQPDFFETDGEVTVRRRSRSLNHGRMCTRIALRLWLHAWRHRLGEVFCNGTGFVLQHQPTVVRGPDVCFVRASRLREMDGNHLGLGAPDLVVEVASSPRETVEAFARVAQLLDAGASLAWVVDLRKKAVIVFDAAGRTSILREGDVLDGGDVMPAFTWPVGRLFGRPWA